MSGGEVQKMHPQHQFCINPHLCLMKDLIDTLVLIFNIGLVLMSIVSINPSIGVKLLIIDSHQDVLMWCGQISHSHSVTALCVLL